MEILATFWHYFKLDLKIDETICRIWKVEEKQTVSDCTHQK